MVLTVRWLTLGCLLASFAASCASNSTSTSETAPDPSDSNTAAGGSASAPISNAAASSEERDSAATGASTTANSNGSGGKASTAASSAQLAPAYSAAGGAMSYASSAASRGGAYSQSASAAPRPAAASGGAASTGDTAPIDGAAAAGAPNTPVDQCALLDATKPVQLYLSSDDSNSMASPTIARSIIKSGGVPPAYIIRTYEFLNYYDLGYERAGAGQLALSLEMAPGDKAGTYALQLGVSSEAAAFVRRPMSITFVLDTSGSMSGDPINRSKAAVKAIASSLKQGDIVSAVTWNDTNSVVLDSVSVAGPNDATVLAMAEAMQANGSTNLEAGLRRGYELAQKNFVASNLNRVVLISDGQANTGITDENIIAEGANLNDGDGIYLVGVGVGTGVNDTLMNTVTDKGRGAYIYLDSELEAARMFVNRFDEAMDVAARAVQVRLDLPWYLGVAKFYGEKISTDARAVEPQHLAPNDAMVFDQILKPCAAEQFLATDAVTLTANWSTPTTHESKSATASTTLGALLTGTAPHLPKAQAIIAYAEALKAGTTQTTITAARTKVAAAMAIRSDADLQEIDTLLQLLDARVN